MISVFNRKVKNKLIINSIIVLILGITFHVFMFYSFSDMGYTVSTLSNITSKTQIGEKYYIYIKEPELKSNIRLGCGNETYTKISTDKNIYYTIEYRRLSFIHNKGFLGKIDMSNYIDNNKY